MPVRCVSTGSVTSGAAVAVATGSLSGGGGVVYIQADQDILIGDATTQAYLVGSSAAADTDIEHFVVELAPSDVLYAKAVGTTATVVAFYTSV